MIEDLLAGLLGVLPPLPGTGRRRRRQWRNFEAGRVVTFEAGVLGAEPYCRPEIGVLNLSRTELLAAPSGGLGATGRKLPMERIEVVLVRDRLRSDPKGIRPHWRVAECRDEDAVVLLGCAPGRMELLLHALRRTPGR
ncbi:hypothetical protein [Kitasatospora sp. NPDC088346]|uniref:hypothetical protein n=1 Tax=Kitasatospora sp. NPDC088346 TaxID=3364073 RepID=UPI003830DF13